MGQVYLALNTINGMGYVGATTRSMLVRRKEHECDVLHDSTLPFHLALLDFGFESFEWSILVDDVVECDLERIETEMIKEYDTFHPAGYNRTQGGTGSAFAWNEGFPHSEETKQKIKAKAQNRNEQWRIRQSEVQKAVHASKTPEERAAYQDSKRGKTYEEIYGEEKAKQLREIVSKTGKGKSKPEEWKRKLKERWNDPEFRALQHKSRSYAHLEKRIRKYVESGHKLDLSEIMKGG